MNPYEKYYLRQKIVTGAIALGAVALIGGGVMLWQPWNRQAQEETPPPAVEQPEQQAPVEEVKPDLTITVAGQKVDCMLYRGDGWTIPYPMDWTVEENGDQIHFIPPEGTKDSSCLTVTKSEKPAYKGSFISANQIELDGKDGFERLFYHGDARGFDVACKMTDEDMELWEKTMTAMARTMTVGDERPFASLYPMASEPEWQVVDGEVVLFLDKDGVDIESIAEAAVRSRMSGWSNEKKKNFTGQYRLGDPQWVSSYTCVVDEYVDVFALTAEYQVVSGKANDVDLDEGQVIRNGWLSDEKSVLYVAIFHDGSSVTRNTTVWGTPGYQGAEFVTNVIR